MAVNSLRKDWKDKHNPVLRSLAVRTMGQLRVDDIREYLLECLKDACADEEP